MAKTRFKGSYIFDGNIRITVKGQEYNLKTDYGGFRWKEADPEREIIALVRDMLPYNEVKTGFAVFPKSATPYKVYLKPTPRSKDRLVYHFTDILAWGYVDEAE